jgi:hypothetical protein
MQSFSLSSSERERELETALAEREVELQKAALYGTQLLARLREAESQGQRLRDHLDERLREDQEVPVLVWQIGVGSVGWQRCERCVCSVVCRVLIRRPHSEPSTHSGIPCSRRSMTGSSSATSNFSAILRD